MKGLKIILVFATILVIGIISYLYLNKGLEKFVEPPKPPNEFVNEINKKIDNLSKSSTKQFCVNSYISLNKDINEYANAGKIDTELSSSLLKNLDYIYTTLFIGQANSIFQGTAWEHNDLNIIKDELKRMQSSKYIVDKKELIKIEKVLNQYDEISSFIWRTNTFANDVKISRIDEDFDISTTKVYITRANEYKNLNGYIGNCKRLQSKLTEIPGKLFTKHMTYLTNKVNFCTNKYKEMRSQEEYFNKIYRPIFLEFQVLEENFRIYNIKYLDFERDLLSLKNTMRMNNNEAEEFSYPKQ